VPFEAKKVALVVPPPASADVPRMLASWSWLVGGRFRPRLLGWMAHVTAFGSGAAEEHHH